VRVSIASAVSARKRAKRRPRRTARLARFTWWRRTQQSVTPIELLRALQRAPERPRVFATGSDVTAGPSGRKVELSVREALSLHVLDSW